MRNETKNNSSSWSNDSYNMKIDTKTLNKKKWNANLIEYVLPCLHGPKLEGDTVSSNTVWEGRF